jgi:predicted dehydrogenase
MSMVRIGMVGGGAGSFIGNVHRIAARMDGLFALKAGVFSSDAERNRASGAEIGVDPGRVYDTVEAMLEGERGRSDAIEAVVVCTPNHLHHAAAKASLEAGFHVICDKPLTSTLEDALDLKDAAERSGRVFVLTHNYTGYPMIRQMREMVAAGDIGDLRLVQSEYAQDWLSEAKEREGVKGAEWRTDPARSGAGGSLGDIGTHAYNLASFVTGREPRQVLADLTSFVPGRRLDDNASILLRYEGGARGIIWVSQVAVGNENRLTLRVYGSKGGLEWEQENPNYLRFTAINEPTRTLTRAGVGASAGNVWGSRVAAGLPEGYFEAFANVYRAAAAAIRGHADVPPHPSATDGLRGLVFIDACVKSNKEGGSWIELGSL